MRNRTQTADRYGGTKYVHPGTLQAMKVYINLPGKKSDLFLEPANNAVGHVSVAQHLKRFGRMFMGLADPPNSTLIRKFYHTRLFSAHSTMQSFFGGDAELLELIDKVGLVLTSEK